VPALLTVEQTITTCLDLLEIDIRHQDRLLNICALNQLSPWADEPGVAPALEDVWLIDVSGASIHCHVGLAVHSTSPSNQIPVQVACNHREVSRDSQHIDALLSEEQ